jgi:hypothetical protein
MRVLTLVTAGILATCVAFPAAAAKKPARASMAATYEACEAKAHAQGLDHTQNGHIAFVRECMGFRPGSRRGG